MNINATILGQAIAFILFVLFCMKYVWPPLMAAIEKRQKEVAEGLASAERAKKDLDLAQANATDQLKKAKEEAQVIIEQANKRRSQILDEVKAEAEQERNKIVTQALAEIDAERKRAREELRSRVAMLAVAGAERIIERSVDEAANSDIVDKLVAEL
ncbi:F0F1 ATP synthase subunit B [Erwinia tasmaniensis]|uniref:F0F1 ATP synthase subunit B n=1 Tax=Erwinia tasmaniensis TaxID=338565 RepID=UPI003A4D435A